MDENNHNKTANKQMTTESKLWLPPLSPQDQKKLDRLRKDRKKPKQLLIIVASVSVYVGVIALIDISSTFNWPSRVWVPNLLSLWMWVFSLLPLWMWMLSVKILIGIVLLILLILLIRVGGYTTQRTGFKGKTLWNWLKLLATLLIPLVVVGATIGFGWWQAQLADLQHQTDTHIAMDQQQQTTLENYMDRMTNLLLSNSIQPRLYESRKKAGVRVLAQAMTLTTLSSRLNPEQKESIVLFLYQAGLTLWHQRPTDPGFDFPILNLYTADLKGVDLWGTYLDDDYLRGLYMSGANLSDAIITNADLSRDVLSNTTLNRTKLDGTNFDGALLTGAYLNDASLRGASFRGPDTDLSGAHLNGANLSGADLNNAHLSGTDLSGAYFIKSNLNDTYLNNAHLSGTDLSGAYLINADLSGADLSGADLSGAYLNGATLTQQQLDQVRSCKNAILPQGLTCHSTPSP